MDVRPSFRSSIVLLLLLWSACGTIGTRNGRNHTQSTAPPAKRMYGAFVDSLSIVVGVGALITGIACTDAGGCTSDVISQRIEALFSKVDDIENQITSLQKEVAEIRHDIHVKWYFDLIKYMTKQMGILAEKTINNSTNKQDLDLSKMFVDQNLGVHRDDYVCKALYLIPSLITHNKVIEHYLRYLQNQGVDEEESIQKTCDLAKGMLQYQDDGYASVILAYSIAFRDDPAAYNDALAETCALWRSESVNYARECQELQADFPEGYEDRRQSQVDYIRQIEGLESCPLQSSEPNESDWSGSGGSEYI